MNKFLKFFLLGPISFLKISNDVTIESNNGKTIENKVKGNKKGEIFLTGTLKLLGNAVVANLGHKYSIIQVDNNIVTNVHVDNFIVSFLDVGSSYTFKIYKFFPLRNMRLLFSIENEEGKFKIRKRFLIIYLGMYNMVYLFGGIFTIMLGASLIGGLLNDYESGLIIAVIIHLIQVVITNFKVIKAYINS